MGFLDANGITRLCTKLKNKFAAISHNHAASDVTSGTFDSARLPTVPIEKGGTGATTAANALASLGAASSDHTHTAADVGAAEETHTHDADDIDSGTLSSDRLPTVPISKGGTGETTASAAWTALGGGSIGKKDSLAASDIPDLSGTYLPLSGGTMSGNIEMQSNTIDRDGAAPSSYQQGRSIILQDKDGERIGLLRADRSTVNNGAIHLNIGVYSENSGTEVPNLLTLKALPNGTNSVEVTDPAAWRSGLEITPANIGAAESSHTHSYLPLSGGTLTGTVISTSGGLNLRSTGIDEDTTPSSEQTGGTSLVFSDKDGVFLGAMGTKKFTDGRQGIRIQSRYTVNGAGAWNWLDITTKTDGTPYVQVGAQSAWRRAFGLGNSSGDLPITVAQGGSGRTTLTSNAVLAGNGTGQVKQIATASGALFATAANGAASFGTLPVAQGGTGATSAADARTNLEITPANIGAAASSHTHSYISTSGGTATGDIKIKSTNINRDGTNPSATANGKSLVFHDNDAERVGVIRTDQSTDGAVTLLVGAFAEKSDGTEVPNWLQLMSKKDGTRSVTVSDAGAWRTAISAAASSHNHSGANITSGTIDVARLPYTGDRGVEISGSTIRTVNGYISAMNATKITKSSGNGTWTITQTNIEITNTGETVYVLAFFQISINSIDIKTTNGAWYTTASDQVLAFPWTLGKAPRVVSMGTNVDRIQDIWIKKIETTKITFRPMCVQSATVTWAGEFVILSNKSA